MRFIDHMLLGRHLWLNYADQNSAIKRKAFLLGCVEPDFNYLTYFRGFRKHKKPCGHNAENLRPHIKRCLKKMQRKSSWNTWDCFCVGTLMHYVADSFTFAHNEPFGGNIKEHIRYEHILHHYILRCLAADCQTEPVSAGDRQSFFENRHSEYLRQAAHQETDSRYIIDVCSCLFLSLCRELCPITADFYQSRGIYYESSYHNRLV